MIWVTVCDYCRCVQCLLVSKIDMSSLQPCVRWWRSCRRTGRLHAVWEALPISATASCFYRVMSGRNALIESITNCWLTFLYQNVNELEKTFVTMTYTCLYLTCKMPPSRVVIIKYPNIFKEEFENVTESCQGIQPTICWSLQIKMR